MGRERPELSPGLRSFVVGHHVIFYRLFDGGVESDLGAERACGAGDGFSDTACAAFGEVTRKYPRASSGVKAAVDREQKRVKC